ncbi:MAG: hypothetical protein RI893_27 [Pseudomonadota bacterium]|jgi:DNA-damage-inducible protein J
MPSTVIHTPIDIEIDVKAKQILSNFGLSMNDAIALFLNQVVENNKMPFPIDLPNKETIAAIEDARTGNVHRYSSLETMWEDLDGN